MYNNRAVIYSDLQNERDDCMEQLTIRYIPLDDAVPWDRNPKKHDIGALVTSIWRFGFQDPPKFDAALGGIVYGNGRLEALAAGRKAGKQPPRGIGVDEAGRWVVPVVFGVDQASRAMAEAFAVDHNNLTMMGGDFTAIDLARMWEGQEYVDLLADLVRQGEAPVSVDGDDLDALGELLEGYGGGPDGEGDGERSKGELLSLIDITIADPVSKIEPGEVWQLGTHVLACLDVITDWPAWVPLLEDGMLLAPYAGPFVLLSTKADERRFLLVQPDPYIAGHIVDRWLNVKGTQEELIKFL